MKNEIKHTPGPWKIGKEGRIEAPTPGGGCIIIVHERAIGDYRNRPLIAAAPAMLAACERAELTRQSLERAMPVIKAALQSKGIPSNSLDGILRGLSHAQLAVAQAEGRKE